MSALQNIPRNKPHKQDLLRTAFRRLHRHSTFTYREVPTTDPPAEMPPKYNALPLAPDLPESKPARSFTKLFKAAIRRAMRSVNSES